MAAQQNKPGLFIHFMKQGPGHIALQHCEQDMLLVGLSLFDNCRLAL